MPGAARTASSFSTICANTYISFSHNYSKFSDIAHSSSDNGTNVRLPTALPTELLEELVIGKELVLEELVIRKELALEELVIGKELVIETVLVIEKVLVLEEVA